ncbi:MAG: cytochrome c3 family protein [Pseudomonadota bacterium]
MRHLLSIRTVAAATLLIFAGGCAENATHKRGNGNAATAYGNGNYVVFPHLMGWAEPNAHGVAAIDPSGKLAVDRCNECHDLNGTGNGTDGPPGCKSCHTNFPHPDGWGATNVHITTIASTSNAMSGAIRTNCATSCHGAGLQGGLSSVSCRRCHSQYPHDPGWKNAGAHGARALGQFATGLPECSNCHGIFRASPGLTPNCVTCHDDLPDPSIAVQHEPAKNGPCTACHVTDVNKAAGPHLLAAAPPVLCTKCHIDLGKVTTYKHSVAQTGDSCLRCHRPHNGTLPHLLTASEPQLCFNCHNAELTSTQYGTTRNMQAILNNSRNLHDPFQKGNCTACHAPHGSEHTHLLETEDAMFWLSGNTQNYSCFRCHDYATYVTAPSFKRPATIARPSSSLPTQFVKTGTTTVENLHWYHLAITGASCLSCHDPHGNDDSHLLRSYILPTDPGPVSFWDHGKCQECHAGNYRYLPGYPNNLW